uniref:Putative regulatory protein FmdB zinc ribbon domain-containing protein n=1 Tax=viral metagenome TaxID=1070528 RepID=A0A6M3JT35_9ZZZZ
MPLYRLECPRCGAKAEIIQGYNDSLPVCKCGATMRILISACNHTFGWRLTEKSHEKFQKDEIEKDV